MKNCDLFVCRYVDSCIVGVSCEMVCIRYVSFNYVMFAVLKISARKKKIFYYRKRENDYV